MAIPFRQLEVFRAVGETASFTRASHILFISQSTVSQHIRELEDRLKVRLLDRNRRRVALTPAGAALLEHARRVFRQLEEAEAAVQTGGDPYSGKLCFGCASTTLLYLLPPVLIEYARKYPEVELSIMGGTIQEVSAQLWAGALDFALVVLPLAAPGLAKTPLFEEPLLAVLPARHRLAARPRLTIQDLAGERFILHRPGQNTRKLIDRFFFRHKIAPRVIVELAETETIKEMVAHGLGVSLLPASALSGRQAGTGLKTFRIAGKELARTLALVHLRPRALRPPAAAMIELLQRHFASRAGA
ncbi:MAG: LysR family transcriptional regulator [Acidobacteria bacterium]|jgi:DNA-binding transcriptional LysR family regulator|nr:LysR family transcriptional regulator [Acidobacteriota bacterium]